MPPRGGLIVASTTDLSIVLSKTRARHRRIVRTGVAGQHPWSFLAFAHGRSLRTLVLHLLVGSPAGRLLSESSRRCGD